VNEVSVPPPQKRRPFEGWGTAAANGLAAATGALVRVSGKLLGEAHKRAASSAAEFRARPEHSRWRAYALGSYGAIVAATLVGQLYTTNGLGAYVRVQPVELPALTQIFVRNDSKPPWRTVKLTLNGIYTFEQVAVQPGQFILLPVNRFAVSDQLGKRTYAPKNIQPKVLTIDTDEQHYETELKP
jgi:hypothetical protein